MKAKSGTSKTMGKALFIAISIVLAVAPAILTSKFGFGISPILTGSMQPDASPGDVYITRLVNASELQVGDVIAVNNQLTGTYYSHRITEIRQLNGLLRVTTKGDANQDIDRDPYMVSPVGEVSKVVSLIPYVGHPMVYMNTIQGRQAAATFLVVANILALFAFLFRKKIVANFSTERIYRELYAEERLKSERYRQMLESMNESLEIERETKEKAGIR